MNIQRDYYYECQCEKGGEEEKSGEQKRKKEESCEQIVYGMVF